MAIYEQRLKEITGGRPPEEGDFNTARLTASDTPPSVRRAIQAELAEVECSDSDDYDNDGRLQDFHIVKGNLHHGDQNECLECNPPVYE